MRVYRYALKTAQKQGNTLRVYHYALQDGARIRKGLFYMVKHIILWKLKESLGAEEKRAALENIKRELEALTGVVPGLISMKIVIDSLKSSNADVMMDSAFESEEALNGYQKHPAHVKAADTYVRPFVEVRMCMDYTE